MAGEIEHIVSLLNSTFEKNPWYGPSVKEVLSDIQPEWASKRLGHTHSIIELVAHMTSWRLFVIKRLEGDNQFTITDELNFPAAMNWPKVVMELYKSQEQLLRLLTSFPASRLFEVVPQGSGEYTFYTLLHGIIHHDVYHTGQISLIKKS
ncbi:DinB family protein [Chryseolinea sp. H1M3-3]|uniref:DinB family protein n=1 Tax=Chryseolinea sp. H1M3-3 TaxID=3034144 RepID=UPI0023EB1A6D|nr:DinB family protein [Chryseolinea sp. H1M3-3]